MKIMPKCTTVCIFRVSGVFVRSLFPELLLEGVWHAFSESLVSIGAPIGAPCGHFWQRFQGLILEAVLGWQKRAKSTKSEWAGGRGGASRLCLWQNSGIGLTRLAPCRRHGAADPKGFAHCRRPLSSLSWRDWWLFDWYTLKMILSPSPSIFA